MKKRAAFLLILVLMVSLSTVQKGWAESSSTKIADKIWELSALEILDQTYSQNMDLQKEINFEQFAQMVIHALNMDGALDMRNEYPYTDLIYRLELLDGVRRSGGAKVDLNTAEQVILNGLGYKPLVLDSRQKIEEYQKLAAQNKLTKDISPAGSNLTILNAMTMVYNSLEVNVISGNGDHYQKDKTLYNNLTYQKKMIRYEGVVNANDWTSLLGYSDQSKGIVNIGDREFHEGITGAGAYLGYRVELYAKETDNEYSITAIRKTSKNTDMILLSEDIDSFNKTELQYEQGDETKTERLSDNMSVIYNGKLLLTYQASELIPENGSIKLIDNNEDNIYDVAVIQDSKDYTIDKVDQSGKIIYLKDNVLNGSSYIDISESTDVEYMIKEDTGKELTIRDLKQDDVITVCASYDNDIMIITKITNKITGIITEISSSDKGRTDVTIAGAVYYCRNNQSVLGEIELDADVEAYVLDDNRIVSLKKIQSDRSNIAMIQDIEKTQGVSAALTMRLIVGGKPEYQEDDNDKDGIIDDRYYKVKNKEMIILSTENKVALNGVKMNAEKMLSYLKPLRANSSAVTNVTVIAYNVDSSGKIDKIDIMSPYGTYGSRNFDYQSRIFGGSIGGAFLTDDSTGIIVIPSPSKIQSGYNEEDYLAEMRMETAPAQGFDVDSDTKLAKAAIIQPVTAIDNSILEGKTAVTMVNRLTRYINHDGEAVYRLSGFSDGKEFVKDIDPSGNAEAVASTLKQGDLIYCGLNYMDKIDDIQKVISDTLTHTSESFYKGTPNVEEDVFGLVEDAKSKMISDICTTFQDYLRITVNGIEYIYYLPTINKTPVYRFDTQKKTVSLAKLENIHTQGYAGDNTASKIYLKLINNKPMVIVIID